MAPSTRIGVPAPGLVLLSVVGIQAGHACGKMLFDAAGPAGVVAMRLAFTAVVLLGLSRPRLPTDGRSVALVVGFGLALAGVNTIYLAMAHLPLGAAVTIQFLGPLTLALAGSRRTTDVVWALLAATGVYLFFGPSPQGLSIAGVLLALVSGACWAAYIVLSQRAGARATDGSILALAVAVAAVISVPVGLVSAHPALLEPRVLAAGFGVALLSAILPYSLDLVALRRMPAQAFGVLMSLEPVLAGLAGSTLLAEHLDPTQWTAIISVTIASIGVVVRNHKHPHAFAGTHAPSRSPESDSGGTYRWAGMPRTTLPPQYGIADTQLMDRLSVGGTSYSIGRAERADVSQIVTLLREDRLGAGRELNDLAPYEAAFEAIDRDPNHLLVVVKDDSDAVVGTMQLTLLPGLARGATTRLQIEAVRIAASARGSGLGAALLEWAHDYGRKHGAVLAQLTTDKARHDAHRFYGRLGYKATHEGMKRPLNAD